MADNGALLPLVLEDVSFVAGGRAVVDRVSATLEAGSRTVILGANGAGKSVLMRLCHGMLAPSSGRLRWHRTEAAGAPRRQAMVFQRAVLLRRSTVANVVLALRINGVPRRERQAVAMQALARVGLGALADRPARVLSGGEQQRLALARAWALAPEVLFLDEPTANLDPGATREVETVIQAIHEAGTKIVLITHNLGQARRLADEILYMDRGRLAERAPVERFFAQPATAEAAAFLQGELPWH